MFSIGEFSRFGTVSQQVFEVQLPSLRPEAPPA
jgi:hypothetical protein